LGLQLVPLVNRVLFDGQGIAPEPLNWVLFCVVLGDLERFEFLRKQQITKSCRICGEALVVVDFGNLLSAADIIDPVAGIVVVVCVLPVAWLFAWPRALPSPLPPALLSPPWEELPPSLPPPPPPLL
jgi:hypothetical protein